MGLAFGVNIVDNPKKPSPNHGSHATPRLPSGKYNSLDYESKGNEDKVEIGPKENKGKGWVQSGTLLKVKLRTLQKTEINGTTSKSIIGCWRIDYVGYYMF